MPDRPDPIDWIAAAQTVALIATIVCIALASSPALRRVLFGD